MAGDGNNTTATNGNTDYQLVNRVMSYGPVTQLVDNAKTYYSSAKEYSPVVKSVSETLEVKLEESIRLVTPTVQKVTPTVQPYLATADSFAVRQLDLAENLAESLSASSKAVQERAVTLAKNSRETLTTTVIPNVDNYLKASPLNGPLNVALAYSEKVADSLLPAANGEAKTEEGPVYRAGNLSVRIGNGLQTQYETLRAEAPQKAQDLLASARANLDAGVATTSSLVAQANPAQVSAAVNRVARETYEKLYAALEALSARIPEDYKNKTVSAFNELRSKEQVQALTDVLRANGEKLQHASEQLSAYIKNSERLPGQLAKVTDALTAVVESLLAHTQKATPAPSQ